MTDAPAPEPLPTTLKGLVANGWPAALPLMALSLMAVLSLQQPLFADEAYYLAWSRAPSLGYFDHPPMFAWWTALLESPRLTSFCCAALSSLVLADAARRANAPYWQWVPTLYLWTPLGFGSGFIGTPDAVCVLFFCLTLWGMIADRLLVVTVGLGLMLWSKHTSLIVWPGVFVVLGPRKFAACAAGAIALYTPHLYWSSQHDWLPWSFQLGRQRSGFAFHDFLGGQMLVLGPWFLFVCLKWFKDMRKEYPRLWWMSAPIFLFWCALSLVTKVEANWTALAWPAVLIGLTHCPFKSWRTPMMTTGGITLLIGLGIGLGSGFIPIQHGPPRDGERLAACVGNFEAGQPYTIRYQEQSLLEAAGMAPSYRRPPNRRKSQYDLWTRDQPPRCGGIYVGPPGEFDRACPEGQRGQTECGGIVAECMCPKSGRPMK